VSWGTADFFIKTLGLLQRRRLACLSVERECSAMASTER